MSEDLPNSFLELLVFALPATMLVLLVVLLVRGIARRRTPDPRIVIKSERVGIADFNARQSPNAPGADQPAGNAGQPMTLVELETSTVGDTAPAADTVAPETRKANVANSETQSDEAQNVSIEPQNEVATPPVAAPAAALSLARLQETDREIEGHVNREPTAVLAALHLERAELLGTLNRNDDRKASLLSAVAVGQTIGDHRASAQARLELAKLAQQAGDMTTACEHWQLARVALMESGQTDEHDRVDKMMRENGCPTDWVLNDF